MARAAAAAWAPVLQPPRGRGSDDVVSSGSRLGQSRGARAGHGGYHRATPSGWVSGSDQHKQAGPS